MTPKPISNRLFRLLVIAALALSLPACQKAPATNADGSKAVNAPGTQTDPDVTGVGSAATPAAPAPDLGDFKIVSVLLGKTLDAEHIVVGDSDSFSRKDKIHASVLSTGAHAGLRLSAKWLAPDGSLVAETQQPLVPTAATATTFSVQNPTGWPEGEYQLLVGVNGSVLQTRKFNVH